MVYVPAMQTHCLKLWCNHQTAKRRLLEACPETYLLQCKDCNDYNAKREPDSGKKRPFWLVKESNKLRIDHKHNYYYQVQGQAAISGLEWVDFVVMTDLGLGDRGIFVQRIYADGEAWQSTLLPKLSKFYFLNILPELVKAAESS